MKPGTRGASRAPTGPLGRQLTDTLVEHCSLPPRPLGQVGDGEGRSAAKGWAAIDVPAQWVSFFVRPPPASPAAPISKIDNKPAAACSTDSTGVPFRISKRRTPIELSTLALERPRQVADTQ
jgi:hypothetical protein